LDVKPYAISQSLYLPSNILGDVVPMELMSYVIDRVRDVFAGQAAVYVVT